MRRLFIIPAIALLFTPFYATALTGPESLFVFLLNGRISADATNTCNDTATARFDWVLGQPAIVHDATANCTAAGGDAVPSQAQDVFWFD